MDEKNGPGVNSVRTVGVPVSDQDRALEFYVDRLGFEKRVDFPIAQLGSRWIEVAPPDGATTVALVLAREGTPCGVDTGIRLSTGDAAGLRESLQNLQIDVGELLQWPGVPPMFDMRDPDGNVLYIVE